MQLHKLAVLAVVFCLLSAGNHETRGGEAKTHSDIEFANIDGHSLKLDLYLPDNQNAPLVVFIHGGSWKQGPVLCLMAD